jgi:hypothetical protein
MASLRELHQAIFPAARPLVELDGGRGDREVTWVRVLKPRVPAFDALEAGDLAIVPAASLAIVAPAGGDAADLVEAFERATVPAVLLVDGDRGERALDALEMATLAAGITAFRMPRTDTIQVERSVIGYLVNRRAELDRRAADLEAQLARLALLGRGLDVLAAAIGSFFGRAVVIEGRRGDALAINAPADIPSAAAAVSRYLARSGDAALRIPIPAPAGEGGGGGRLVLLGDDPPAELEQVAGERMAGVLALELARDAEARQAREEVRRGDPLPADGPPWVVLVARQQVAEDPDDIAAREETRAELRLLAPARRLTLRGTSESLERRFVAAATAGDPGGLLIAARIAEFVHRTVAVSRPFDEPGGRPPAEAAARSTLEAAEALEEPPKLALAERLPAYVLLANLRNLPDARRQARSLLAPLLTGGARGQRDRLATLRAVLETDGLGAAAARLGVHRNTVSYRVRRLEQVGGWDLSDADLRLALLLAIRIVQREQTGA